MPAVSPLQDDAVADVIRDSANVTFSAIWGETPLPCNHGMEFTPTSAVAGIISFSGDVALSVSLVLPEESAPAMVRSFAGLEIPFDSSDMGDAVGELVNILAGEIVAKMERQRLKVQMGLPVIARGCPLQLLTPRHSEATCLDYTISYGRFWLALVSPAPGATSRSAH